MCARETEGGGGRGPGGGGGAGDRGSEKGTKKGY